MKRFDQINVIPFIDVMLVLLAIVLTTATFIAQGQIPVTLPASQAAAERHDDGTLEITIDAEGKVFLAADAVTGEQLDQALSALGHDSRIVLRVDASTAFQAFVTVADQLKAHGHERVSIVTDRQP